MTIHSGAATNGARPADLDPLARAFINRYQGGFPIGERPFHVAAQVLGTGEAALIETVRTLLDTGILSRFGPLYDAERLGGCFTLAAMAVPESEFEKTAAELDELPEVAHNYRRDHTLNMWFVLATSSEQGLQGVLRRIQTRTGLKVYDFPKLTEYHLGFWIHLEPNGTPGLRRWRRERPPGVQALDRLDQDLVAATQAGLPLVPEPYAQLAAGLGWDPETLTDRLTQLLDWGAIRRIGAVPNHYRLGLRGNGMTVWDIEDTEVDRLGAQLGTLETVTHCYRRPRRPPLWPYNLFAMVHGRDRAQVLVAARQIESLVGPHCRGHRVLFSEAVLKKTGLRFS